MTNNNEILKDVPNEGKNEILQIDKEETIKTLGLQWNPNVDEFSFNIDVPDNSKITKRQALSILAKIFDPLGWLTPITVVAKLFIQKLWLINSDWDQELDENLILEWISFAKNLNKVKEISIPRWLGFESSELIQLHGFADASEKAYAAVVYIKTSSKIMLISAKSKVNPIKNRKTLPKLELCAACLLAKLLHKIKEILKIKANIFCWSDSMITLSWIKNNKSKDKFIRTQE